MASRKNDPASALAEKLLAVLEAQRRLGKDAYPLPLQRLVQLTDAQATTELVIKAIGKKLFKERTLLCGNAKARGLVVFAEDIEPLAGSVQLLEVALESLCTADKPLWPLAKVCAAIKNSKLKKAFADAVARQIRDNTLPPTVGCRLEKNKPLLYLQRIPPPPPPKKPEVVLGEKLLAVLQAQRQLGTDAYPLTLDRLVELTSPGAAAKLVKAALAHPDLQGKLARVEVNKQQALIALAEDRAQLISSRGLIESLLRAKRQSGAHAFAIESLLPKKSDLQQPFQEAVKQRIEVGSLPPAIGWMWIGKKQHLFFLEDVHGGQPMPERAAPADFARTFDEAFNHIDRHNGAHNFVNLMELRRRLLLGREVFDAELRKLRIGGRYTLSAAEGRHGLSAEERDAGIVEDGSLLLYVSRKTP